MRRLTGSRAMCAVSLLNYNYSSHPKLACAGCLCMRLVAGFVGRVVKRGASMVISNRSYPFMLVTYTGSRAVVGGIVVVGPPGLMNLTGVPAGHDGFVGGVLCSPVLNAFVCGVCMGGGAVTRTLYSSCCARGRVDRGSVLACFRTTRGRRAGSGCLFTYRGAECAGTGILRYLGGLGGDVSVVMKGDGPRGSLTTDRCRGCLPSVRVTKVTGAGRLPRVRGYSRFVRGMRVFLSSTRRYR